MSALEHGPEEALRLQGGEDLIPIGDGDGDRYASGVAINLDLVP